MLVIKLNWKSSLLSSYNSYKFQHFCWGSHDGICGRAASSNFRDPRFESRHLKVDNEHFLPISMILRIDKIKTDRLLKYWQSTRVEVRLSLSESTVRICWALSGSLGSEIRRKDEIMIIFNNIQHFEPGLSLRVQRLESQRKGPRFEALSKLPSHLKAKAEGSYRRAQELLDGDPRV